jgi:hypothetical protein
MAPQPEASPLRAQSTMPMPNVTAWMASSYFTSFSNEDNLPHAHESHAPLPHPHPACVAAPRMHACRTQRLTLSHRAGAGRVPLNEAKVYASAAAVTGGSSREDGRLQTSASRPGSLDPDMPILSHLQFQLILADCLVRLKSRMTGTKLKT